MPPPAPPPEEPHSDAAFASEEPPTTTATAPTTTTDEDQEVRRFMKQHAPEIGACLPSDPAARVTIRFTVDRDGHVQRSGTDGDSVEQRRFDDCVVGALHGAVFPRRPSTGVLVVSFPWNVDPRP